MTSTEMLAIISKPWSNIKDIEKIACCGRDHATDIRNEIRSNILKKGQRIPHAKSLIVPTIDVIEYFGINVDHIYEMAKKEKMIYRKEE